MGPPCQLYDPKTTRLCQSGAAAPPSRRTAVALVAWPLHTPSSSERPLRGPVATSERRWSSAIAPRRRPDKQRLARLLGTATPLLPCWVVSLLVPRTQDAAPLTRRPLEIWEPTSRCHGLIVIAPRRCPDEQRPPRQLGSIPPLLPCRGTPPLVPRARDAAPSAVRTSGGRRPLAGFCRLLQCLGTASQPANARASPTRPGTTLHLRAHAQTVCAASTSLHHFHTQSASTF